MNPVIDRARVALLCLFLLATAGTIAYQAWEIWPMQKCERAGSWWSTKYHECDAPIPIWRLTGRLPPIPAARAQGRVQR
jgi:hypothetical protein